MESISREMTRFALNLRYNQIPEPVKKEAKRSLLDSIGCAFVAVNNPDMQAAYRYIRKLGGKGQATIFAHGTRTNMPNAALMNSLLIRALDYNDTYWEQDPSHPSDLIPAALAPAEFKNLSGKDLIVGIVIAYELEIRMCHAADPGIREVGWHHATLSQFVSPLVVGRMLGLEEDQMVAAVGLSGASHFTLGGVVAGHLTNMKNTADPLAIEAGVRAAMLAATGYTGPEDVFEGKEGMFEVLSNVHWNPGAIVDRLGETFLMTKCGYKAFPTQTLTHQPITATLELTKENDIIPRDVKKVLVETTSRGADILSDPTKYQPRKKETADHSLPYCIAVALSKGEVLPSHFNKETLEDPIIQGLIPKIEVRPNSEINALFPEVKRAVVTITTRDGSEYKREKDYAKGEPQNPLSNEELIEKFRSNTHNILSIHHQDELIEMTMHLEDLSDLNDFLTLLNCNYSP